jgi:DNA mismatch repair ATPase MutS
LKQIVDAASAVRPDDGRLELYLLDEILHGTNTVERQVAVRRVMTHLTAQRAIGAISTHDLSLADVEPLASRSSPVHFRESFSETTAGRRMTFDYRLRPGKATTTNALALLEMVGLSLDEDKPEPPSKPGRGSGQ